MKGRLEGEEQMEQRDREVKEATELLLVTVLYLLSVTIVIPNRVAFTGDLKCLPKLSSSI